MFSLKCHCDETSPNSRDVEQSMHTKRSHKQWSSATAGMEARGAHQLVLKAAYVPNTTYVHHRACVAQRTPTETGLRGLQQTAPGAPPALAMGFGGRCTGSCRSSVVEFRAGCQPLLSSLGGIFFPKCLKKIQNKPSTTFKKNSSGIFFCEFPAKNKKS